jgi:hypothetical protein
MLPRSVHGNLPSGGRLVWGSNREGGQHEVYLRDLDSKKTARLTQQGGTFPTWSPDGQWIAYYHTANDEGHLVRPDGTGDRKICAGYPMFWIGSSLICDEGDAAYKVDRESGKSAVFYSTADFTKLAGSALEPRGVTADGRYLLGWSDRYRNGFAGDNGTFKAFQAAVVLDLLDKSKLYFFGEGCEPAAPPAGDWIYHVRGDGPTHPDIYRMKVLDLATRASYEPEIDNPDADWGHEYNPRVSNDNRWLVYVATTGCHDQDTCDYEVFVHPLGAAKSARTRLTENAANDQWPDLHVPASSPQTDAGPADAHTGADAGPADARAGADTGGATSDDSGCATGKRPASTTGVPVVLTVLIGLLALFGSRRSGA